MQAKIFSEQAILGVDIAKLKFDVCLMVQDKVKHKMFSNNQKGYVSLVAWCKSHGVELMHVCMEATSHYMEDLASHMHDEGYKVSIVNPVQIKAFAKSELLRGKTDKSDAGVIARFCLATALSQWHPQAKELRQLRDRYRCLQGLKDQHQQIKNKLENDKLDEFAKKSILNVMQAIVEQMKSLERSMVVHVNSYPFLKEKVELLSQIKGIGKLTAIAVIVEMPAIENFKSAKQYAAFAGLTPLVHQSGSSISKRGRICKIGSGRIRKALYMPAITVKNRNEHFRKFHENLVAKGKVPKLIVIAVMRKIMHIFFGMLKNMHNFNPELV